MSVMSVLDHTGDTKHIWDKNRPDEVSAIRAIFDKLTKEKKYLAYSVTDSGDKGAVVREFDPSAERLILAPQLVGG